MWAPRLYFLPLLLNGWNDTDQTCLSTVCASEAGHCDYCSEAFRSLHISFSLGGLTQPPWTCPSRLDFWVPCLRAFISQLEDLHLGVGVTQSARPSLVLYSRWAFKKELWFPQAQQPLKQAGTEMCMTVNTGKRYWNLFHFNRCRLNDDKQFLVLGHLASWGEQYFE